MNSFTFLYLFYTAKLASQLSVYFIWLNDSSSPKITVIAAVVSVLAVFPFFHLLIHVFSAKPFSDSTFIVYLCFSLLLAILWYEPLRDGEQRILPFALVTTLDLLALLIFLLQKQIRHWHNILTWDIEQGDTEEEYLVEGDVDDVSATLVDRDNEQIEHRDFGHRPETSHSEIRQLHVLQEHGYNIDAINHLRTNNVRSNNVNMTRSIPHSVGPPVSGGEFGHISGSGETSRRPASTDTALRGPSNFGWSTRMVRAVSEVEEIGEARVDLEPVQQGLQGGFFIDVDLSTGSDDDSEAIYPSCPVGTPVTTYSDIHPALRPTPDEIPEPVSPEDFQTPKEDFIPMWKSVLESNKI